MIASIIPFLVAEDNYRRDRARRDFVASAYRRQARRARRARARS